MDVPFYATVVPHGRALPGRAERRESTVVNMALYVQARVLVVLARSSSVTERKPLYYFIRFALAPHPYHSLYAQLLL